MDISTKRFAKGSDLVTRCIAGETIVVPVSGNAGDLDSIYTLNEVGSLVWQLLDGHISINQIVSTVCKDYDVGKGEAEKDIIEFIGSLQAAGLIRAHSS